MATTNTTAPIKPITIAAAATPQNIGDSLGLDDTTFAKSPQVRHFSIQNKDTTNSIYIQESAAAAAADSVEVKAGDFFQEPYAPDITYDLREYWVRVAVDGQKVVVKYKRA